MTPPLGGRGNGPTKGRVVFVCETDAISSSYVAEPLLLTSAQFAAMEAGGSFSGTLTNDPAANVKYAVLTFGSVDTIFIQDLYLGVGDGSEVTFTKDFSITPIKSAAVYAGAVTGATASVDEGITGVGITSGSVTVDGVFTVTFTAPPAIGTPILVSVTRGV